MSNKLNKIDKLLDQVTIYRLAVYILIFDLFFALVMSIFGKIPQNPIFVVYSASFFVLISLLSNFLFSRIFKVQANVESVYITALILSLIVSPAQNFVDVNFYILAVLVGVFAQATKYLFQIKKRHIFNPVAISVTISFFLIGDSASWWIGNAVMFPVIFISGVIIVQKLRRFDTVLTFFLIAFVGSYFYSFSKDSSLLFVAEQMFLNSPLLFFGTIMLTEPFTMPSRKWSRILYACIVGFFTISGLSIGSFYFTPAIALLIGNVFSYLVNTKEKLTLRLIGKNEIAQDTYEFIFENSTRFVYRAGEYLEWTLAHTKPDSRGNRRFFTIASSPTEKDVRLAIRFYPRGSSFKKKMMRLRKDDLILAGSRGGEFVLPTNKNLKLTFIAGGIGITPFRSMVKYLFDKEEKRDVQLFYSNRAVADIAYKDFFDSSQEKTGLKIVYTITDEIPNSDIWQGKVGRIDEKMLKENTSDWQERRYYISGTHVMVGGIKSTLLKMGVKRKNIKTDFFPGYV